MVGYDKEAARYSVSLNGTDLSELPEAPKTAAQVDHICKSANPKKYSETIR